MTRHTRRVQRLTAALVSSLALTAGLAAVMPATAGADASFVLQRIAGNDRFLTAGAVDQAAFPAGEPTVLLADAIPGHQADALAASGLEGVGVLGVLLTDNTGTVPASTFTALTNNKVKNVVVLGGPAAVSSSQVTQLQQKGYTVSTPYQGATRWQTMKMVDESIGAGNVGKDSAGNPTAILASGEDAHLVDALSAGGLAFSQKFPVILTNSTGPGLQPEAQQVITDLGIKHLIVVGGTASIPQSEYNPPPTGVSTVDIEYGSDRSATSMALADFAISNNWAKNTNMAVARGDDGSDALAGAAFSGIKGFPTVVTNSTTDTGNTTAFANEHKSTLTGTSYVFGGTAAVPDSQLGAIQTAGGGASAPPATAGPISPAAADMVSSPTPSFFVQSGHAYTYKSSDTYQLLTPSSTPGSSPSCTSSSYADFQARLSAGDQVTGTYNPSGTSTFCLNDQAPAAPTGVKAATGTNGGVTISWTAPSNAAADGISAYQVYRAPATTNPIPQFPATCPAAYSTAPNTSPQNPPPSAYSYSFRVDATSSGNGTYSVTDTSGTANTQYCYAVGSVSTAAAGEQQGTANPANPSSTPGASAQPTPITFTAVNSSATPALSSVSAQGFTVTANYNETVDPASVDLSDFVVSFANAATPTATAVSAYALGSAVYIDLSSQATPGATVTVAVKTGSDNNTVCAAGASGTCEAVGDTKSGPVTAPGSQVPVMTVISPVSTSQKIVVAYSYPVDCASVDSNGTDYAVKNNTVSQSPAVASAACSDQTGAAPPSGTVRSSYVTLQMAGPAFAPTNSVTVTAQCAGSSPLPGASNDGNSVVYAPSGQEEPCGTNPDSMTANAS